MAQDLSFIAFSEFWRCNEFPEEMFLAPTVPDERTAEGVRG
jgi:hypothetical protein